MSQALVQSNTAAVSQKDQPEQLIATLQDLQSKYPADRQVELAFLQCQAFSNKYHKLEKTHLEASLKLSSTLIEFSDVLTRHKLDREQLVLMTKERQTLMERANRHAESSLLVLRQNEVLEQTLMKMQDINRNLMEKVKLLENSLKKEQELSKSLTERLENVYGDTELTQEYGRMLKDYRLLMEQNHDIQEQIRELGQATTLNHECVQLFVLLLGLAAEYLPDVLVSMVRSKTKPYCGSLKGLSKEQLNEQLFKHFPSQDRESILILTEDLKETPFSDW